MIVLSTIPYRYDRFVKTAEQKRLDKVKQLRNLKFLEFKKNEYNQRFTSEPTPRGRAQSETNEIIISRRISRGRISQEIRENYHGDDVSCELNSLALSKRSS